MAFEWVIRHQKKALFVLAVVLIVGWGISGMLSSLLGGRGGRQKATDVVARIAGQDVKRYQIQAFRVNWLKVFPNLLARNSSDSEYRDQMSWAWYGLLTMARQQGIQAEDEWVLQVKRRLYREGSMNANARLDEAADKWFRGRFGMSGQQVDDVIREEILAEKVLNRIVAALQSTKEEAWDLYEKENRAFRVRAAEFPAASYVAQTPEPDNEKVQTWYKDHSGDGKPYYNPPTVQIEYVQVLLAKLEPGVTVTTDEMKAYYDKHQDLFQLKPAAGGKDAEVLPFPEVKPDIEETLKRKAVNDLAAKAMKDLAAAFAAAPETASLEDVVKASKNPALEYFRSPFLGDVQLLDLPGIGVAHAGGSNLAQLAFDMAKDAKPRALSDVMSTAEGRWVFRPAAAGRPGTTPELADVKDRVIADLRRDAALKLAFEAAGAFDNAVVKAGPASFETLVAEKKITLKDSSFFRNNLFDAARPDYIDGATDLAVGKVYGPWVSQREYVAAVVQVIEDRPADRAGFTRDEESMDRGAVLETKRREVVRVFFPKRILDIAHFTDLVPREPKSGGGETEAPAEY